MKMNLWLLVYDSHTMTISIHSVYGDSLYLAELAPRFVDKSDMIRPADCLAQSSTDWQRAPRWGQDGEIRVVNRPGVAGAVLRSAS